MEREDKIREIRRLQKIAEIRELEANQPNEEREPVSQLEAGARGAAQGLSMGWANPIQGVAGAAGNLPYTKKWEDLLGNYRKSRDYAAKREEMSKRQHPNTFEGSQFGGSIASAAHPLGRLGLAAQGAIQGLGTSQADLTKGEFGKALEDTAVGGAVGGAVGQSGKLLSKAASKFKPESLAKTFLNVPEEVTRTYIDNPEAVKKALPRYQLAQKMEDTIETLHQMVLHGSEQARLLLNEIKLKGPEIAGWLNPLRNEVINRAEGAMTDPRVRSSLGQIEGIQKEFNPKPKKIVHDKLSPEEFLKRFYSSPSIHEPLQDPPRAFSGSRAKDLVQQLQRATDWEEAPGKFSPVDKALTRRASGAINHELKMLSPEYEEAMKHVAKDTDLLKRIRDIDKSPAGMTNLFRRMETDKYGASQIPRQTVQEFDNHMGTNYLDKARHSMAKESFDKSLTNGSRAVNMYHKMLGDIPVIGKLAAPLGGAVDKYGGKFTMSIIDSAAAINKAWNSGNMAQFRAIADPIINAAKQGNASAALTLQFLNKTNPDALKYLSAEPEEEDATMPMENER